MIAPSYTPERLLSIARDLARHRVRSQDAEDVAQEAMLRYYRAMHSGRTVYEPERYLARVVQRCAIDQRRARLRQPEPVELREDDIPLRAGGGCRADDTSICGDGRHDVQTLLPGLPPKERAAVEAVLCGGSLERVAQADGVPLATVRRRKQRGVQDLQRLLADPR